MVHSTLSLTWESHKNSICNGLGLLQQNGEFVDMTLAADGHHVKVHQMVIALASPYIKELIISAATPHPIIFLNNTSYRTLKAILEYIYIGEVIVPVEHVTELVQAARDLRIQGFEDVPVGLSLNLPAGRNQEQQSDRESLGFLVERNEKQVSENESVNSGNETEYMEEEVCLFEVTDKGSSPNKKKKRIYVEDGVSGDYMQIAGYKGESRWFSRGGHYYVASRSRRHCTTMRCCGDKCPVRWHLRNGHAGPVFNHHNHPPTPWVPDRNAMFQSLKRRAATENTPLSVIFREEAARFPDAIPYMSWESVAPSMRKWRRRPADSKENILEAKIEDSSLVDV